MERIYVLDTERGAAHCSLSQPAADSGEGGEPGEPDFLWVKYFIRELSQQNLGLFLQFVTGSNTFKFEGGVQ